MQVIHHPRRGRPPVEEVPGADVFLPAVRTLPVLRDTVQSCRGCTLYREATQAVFGEGSPDAKVVLIGEVPGDAEDRAGRPFVGPAGRLLDEALASARIPRGDVYITNAVKHFKFTRRGKKRLHDKPTRYEIRRASRGSAPSSRRSSRRSSSCSARPRLSLSLMGSAFRVTQSRGKVLATTFARWTFATVHPASVLRAPDEELRHEAREALFADFAIVGDHFRRL